MRIPILVRRYLYIETPLVRKDDLCILTVKYLNKSMLQELQMEYFGRTTSIPRLLMHWVLALLDHQNRWHWLSRKTVPFINYKRAQNVSIATPLIYHMKILQIIRLSIPLRFKWDAALLRHLARPALVGQWGPVEWYRWDAGARLWRPGYRQEAEGGGWPR